MDIMKKNSKGSKVTDLQRRLKLLGFDLGSTDIDGIIGPETENAIKKFQQVRSLLVTGIVDNETWQELVDAGYKIGDRLLYLKNPPFRGDDVGTLQLWLKILGFYPNNENGIFCEKTHKALVLFQDNMNIADDGIMGEVTLQHLKNLERIIVSRKTSNFPVVKNLGEDRKRNGFKIILDYSDVMEDEIMEDIPGSGIYLKDKKDICMNIVKYCRDMFLKTGIDAIMTVSDDSSGSFLLFDRIKYANNNDPDLLISINLNYSRDAGANGCCCSYFKGIKSYSIEGFRVASLIQDKLVKNLGVTDCRVHGSSYAILKDTTMASVLIEPAFISNKEERQKISKPDYQKEASKNIVDAVLGYLKK